MSTIHTITGYSTSTDYARLFQLAQKQSIICIVDYKGLRDLCHTLYRKLSDNSFEIELAARGHGYTWTDSEESFIRACTKLNVEFLEPKGDE